MSKQIILSLCFIAAIGTVSYAQGTQHQKAKYIVGDHHYMNSSLSEIAVGSSAFPEIVRTALNKQFAGYVIIASRLNETADINDIANYDVELLKNGRTQRIRITEEGKLIEKSVMSADSK